jgi:hypothetical protein
MPKVGEREDGVACRFCWFWDPIAQHDQSWQDGLCRRHAPRTWYSPRPLDEETLAGDDANRYPYWPKTSEEEWCGDFKVDPRRCPLDLKPSSD